MHNAWWLIFTLIGFFTASTAYIIPYNALLPELTDTPAEKVKLSSFQQVGFVLGIMISALINNFADLVQDFLHVANRDSAVQYTIWGLCVFAGLIMLVPVISIDERKYIVDRQPSHLPLLASIRRTFKQRNFKYYLISDFSYYMALSIISSGVIVFYNRAAWLKRVDGWFADVNHGIGIADVLSGYQLHFKKSREETAGTGIVCDTKFNFCDGILFRQVTCAT